MRIGLAIKYHCRHCRSCCGIGVDFSE